MLVPPLLPWDDVPLKSLVHHLFSKHELVEPVIIGLKKANCPYLIYVNVPKHLSRRTVNPFPQQARGTLVEAASVSLAACIAKR